ncbi:MAG: ATP/GTP-binding protein [Chloroflexota bacterium]|nr:ATP/GTP-binding protein [Chloroflexota bacterium]
MKRALKIVVTGPFGAGKTAFIRTISQIDVVSTERRITRRAPAGKEETTVAMDYGRVTVGRSSLSLFGTPGQKRFDFMWEILSKEMDGFIVLVDSTEAKTFREARRLIKLFSRYNSVPYVVVANKQDLDSAVSPTALSRALNLDGRVKVVPCVATKKKDVRSVLQVLVQLIS